jgi:hypothetical protein
MWNHLAAVLFFAGPLFYFGLWLAIDPAGLPSLIGLLVRAGGGRSPDSSRKLRAGVRLAGLVLVLFAIAL